MIKAYFNYPNSRIRIHSNLKCLYSKDINSSIQRIIKLNRKTFGNEVSRMRNKEIQFASEPGKNDLWVIVDFDNMDFEIAVIKYLKDLLAKNYKNFTEADLMKHC